MLGGYAEEPRHERTDVRREADQEVGNGGRRHPFAETAAIILILPVQVGRSLRELSDERIVEALQVLGLMEVRVPKSCNAEPRV
jgi:hypothetical protein